MLNVMALPDTAPGPMTDVKEGENVVFEQVVGSGAELRSSAKAGYQVLK